jgi:hypothetical protein
MNPSIEGNWNHFKALAERQWARLSDALGVLAGRRARPAANPAPPGEMVKPPDGKQT